VLVVAVVAITRAPLDRVELAAVALVTLTQQREPAVAVALEQMVAPALLLSRYQTGLL
jgi:hypothetical protein